jgi:putative ATPase
MKQVGYGRGYRYAHDEPEGVSAMDCLPDNLRGRQYYAPSDRGQEADLARRLEAARLVRSVAAREGGQG